VPPAVLPFSAYYSLISRSPERHTLRSASQQ